jgi:cell division protein FtsB
MSVVLALGQTVTATDMVSGGVIVGGTVILLTVILNFILKLRAKRNGQSSEAMIERLSTIVVALDERNTELVKMVAILVKQSQDLWTWHSKEDTNGVKLWYTRRSLEQDMAKLVIALEGQTKHFQELVVEQRELKRTIEQMREGHA